VDVKHHQAMSHTETKPRSFPVTRLGDPRLTQAQPREFSGKPQRVDSMQLAHYYRLLQTLGHADDADQVWGAIIGKSLELVWRDLNEPSELALDRTLGRRRKMTPLALYDQEFAHGSRSRTGPCGARATQACRRWRPRPGAATARSASGGPRAAPAWRNSSTSRSSRA
jgi:hypothetical protein